MYEPHPVIKSVAPCLREPNENRIHPRNPGRIEVVFLIEALNYLLLRTEGTGYINIEKLPETDIQVPVIMPQKIHAVLRRKFLTFLREYRNKYPTKVMKFVLRAKELGFVKAKEFVNEWKRLEEEHGSDWYKDPSLVDKVWNCTIQPPVADSGLAATDLGMCGFCPHCVIFGGAFTGKEIEVIKNMSIGYHTRVHPDPAFSAIPSKEVITHNKVSEGLLSTTGTSLYNEIHVKPGTWFVGRIEIIEPTVNELLGILYSLISLSEIGGRQNIYGTIRVHLIGIRCGVVGKTSAMWLADRLASMGIKTPKKAIEILSDILGKIGFTLVSNEQIEELVEENKDLFGNLWRDSIAYVENVVKYVNGLSRPQSSSKKKNKK